MSAKSRISSSGRFAGTGLLQKYQKGSLTNIVWCLEVSQNKDRRDIEGLFQTRTKLRLLLRMQYSQRVMRKPEEKHISLIDHVIELAMIHSSLGSLGPSGPLPKSESIGILSSRFSSKNNLLKTIYNEKQSQALCQYPQGEFFDISAFFSQ